MARVFDRAAVTAPSPGDHSGAAGRSAARPLGAAVACLLVSFLVVTRSQAATQGPAGFARTDVAPAAVSRSDLAAGGVLITSDDHGRSLFRVPAMAPGRPVTNCIAVTYSGTAAPATVRLSTKTGGNLAGNLSVTVEDGTSGKFDDCSDFRPVRDVYSGTLATMASRPPIVAFRSSTHRETHAMRFTFLLKDGARQGDAAATEFAWTAAPD